METSIAKKDVCSNHSPHSDAENGELVCGNCGVVLEEKTLNRELADEKRRDNKEDRTHHEVLESPSLYTSGSMISSYPIDARGDKVQDEAGFHRLRTWDWRTKISQSRQRNLAAALPQLSGFADRFGLPQESAIRSTAAEIYRIALDNSVTKGRSILAVASAALFVAFRVHGYQKSYSDFAELVGVKRTHLTRAYRVMYGVKDLEKYMRPKDTTGNYETVKTEPSAMKIIKKLDFPLSYYGEIMKYVEYLKKENYTAGKSPDGVAAAVMYVLARKNGQNTTQTEIAGAAGVTEVTLRNRYKSMIGILRKYDPEL